MLRSPDCKGWWPPDEEPRLQFVDEVRIRGPYGIRGIRPTQAFRTKAAPALCAGAAVAYLNCERGR